MILIISSVQYDEQIMKTPVKSDDLSEVLGCSRENDPSELEISLDDAKDLLRNDDRVILVDVRSDGEMCLGSIKGARLVASGVITEEA